MAAQLEILEQDNEDNVDPSFASPSHEESNSFLPPIVQSEYVQLAKAGGHKDLLTHHPFVREKDAKPVAYNRVDWWDHPPGIDVVVGKSKPRYYRRSLPAVLEESTPIRLPKIKPLSPEDKWNEAIWKPKPTKVSKNDKLPSIGKESVATLITLKYQKEWVESNDKRCKMANERKKAQKLLKRQRLLEHTKRKKDDKLQDSEATRLFKMSRFENIPSKIHTYHEET